MDVSFSSFLCAREKDRLDFGKKVEALLEEGWVIEKMGWVFGNTRKIKSTHRFGGGKIVKCQDSGKTVPRQW